MEDDEEGGFSGVVVLFIRGGEVVLFRMSRGVGGLLGGGVNWGGQASRR